MQLTYNKPGILARIIYGLLLLIPILLLIRYWYFTRIFNFKIANDANEYLGEKMSEAINMEYDLLFKRLAVPAESMTQMKFPQDSKKLAGVANQYPEVVEFGTIKQGQKYSPLYSTIGDRAVQDTFASVFPSIIDTTKTTNNHFRIFPDSTGVFRFKTGYKKIAGVNYHFNFFQRGEEIQVVTASMDKLQSFMPEVIEKAGKREYPQLFKEYYSPYKTGYSVVMTFTNERGEDFYTLGIPYGSGYKDIVTHKYLSWTISFQLFSQVKDKLALAELAWKYREGENPNFYGLMFPYQSILILAAGVIIIILLGHFSPRLHGFRVKKDE